MLLNKSGTQNRYLLTFFLSFGAAACFLVPAWVLDKGIFLYAGDFNSQQITFYFFANSFVKSGGGSFSWITDLGSSFINSYSFYLLGSPFWWLTLLLPPAAVPYFMAPMLLLKFGVAGGGAYLWARRYLKNSGYAVAAGLLYALSGFSVYNIFFNHFLDVVALFPYMLWALDRTLYENKKGLFGLFVAINLLNNYFFFVGQVLFLAIYFVCKLSAGEIKLNPKLFGTLAFESVAGSGLGCLLVIPALLSLSNNPRTVDLASGYGFLLYGSPQQYLAILAAALLPPDVPFFETLTNAGITKWTSLSAWLPLVGVSGAVAWCRTKNDGLKRILCTCLVFAFVPVLNSAFYALNSSFYARWYYMPTLMAAAASMMALEHWEVNVCKKGILPVACLTLSLAVYAFVPVYSDDTDTWSFGVISHVPWFWFRLVLALLGLLVFWYLVKQRAKQSQLPRRVLAAVLAFGVVNGLVHVETTKFDQWYVEEDTVQQQYVEARHLQWPEDGFYRIDSYGCHDNVGIWSGRSCLQFFNSTVAPAVMEFYPTVGVKRDVSSKPGTEKYELRSLLSVKYTLVDQDSTEEFLEKTEARGWTEADRQGSYVLYENNNYLPMGFTYQYYITEEEYDSLGENSRLAVLLRALALDEEQVEKYGGLLTELPRELETGREYDAFVRDVEDRRQEACTSFETDRSGFTAEYSLTKENLIFFSVPYDAGFTATVNGEPAEVLKVQKGFMAVDCPAGSGTIRFTYHTPGLRLSIALAAASAVLYAGYLVWLRRRKGETA